MAIVLDRVVVFVHENHTTDHYFTSLRARRANVAAGWPERPNPPAHDQEHTRAAYAKWLHAAMHPFPSRHVRDHRIRANREATLIADGA